MTDDQAAKTPAVRGYRHDDDAQTMFFTYRICLPGKSVWEADRRNHATVDRLMELGLTKKEAQRKLNHARKRYYRIIKARGSIRAARPGEPQWL